MRIRRLLIFFTLLTLLFSLTPIAYSYDTPPRGTCTVEGETKLSAGYKFTCIRYGDTGLIWNRGQPLLLETEVDSNGGALPVVEVDIKTNKNQVIKAGQKCKSIGISRLFENYVYKCVKKGEKRVWSKGKPLVPSPTKENKPWENVYSKIWENYRASQIQKDFPFNLSLSDNLQSSTAKVITDAYKNAMKPWMTLIGDTKMYPFNWYIMTKNDYVWWKKVVDEQEPINPNYAWDPKTNMLGHCALDRADFCGYGNLYNRGGSDYKFLQYNVISANTLKEPNVNTVHHEAVHFYQFTVASKMPDDMPCWYIEGQASLFGSAMEFNQIKLQTKPNRPRQDFKGIVIQYQNKAMSFEKEDWISVLKNMYWPDKSCTSEQDYFKYAVGNFNWEYLYDKYGIEKLHQLLIDFRNGVSFENSIQKTLGSNLESLNTALANYLVFVFRDGN
jgi:hypothetical protein